MNRAAKYLQRKFEIDLEEAKAIASNIRYLDKMDNGECLMYFHNMGHLVKKDDRKLVDVWGKVRRYNRCGLGRKRIRGNQKCVL